MLVSFKHNTVCLFIGKAISSINKCFVHLKLDIDECTMDKTACDSNQNCINTPGSFRCECKIGFSMDKVVNACVGE